MSVPALAGFFMKTCKTCKTEKENQEFSKRKDVKSGLQSLCKDCSKTYNSARYLKNREAILEDKKAYNATHKPERNASLRKRYIEDPSHKLVRNLRTRTSLALKGQSKSASTLKLLGGLEAARTHIESLWTAGMTWANNSAEGWQVDHVKAICLFDLSDPNQQRECFHYSNLQPLWREDHNAKTKRDVSLLINKETQSS